MRPETYIAKRLYYAQRLPDADRSRSGASAPAVRVALLGIAIGMAVMVVTLAVVVGFKQTITDKVAGFGAHIQVVNFDNNNTYETNPIVCSDSMLDLLRTLPHVVAAGPYATKPGILKTDSTFQGAVLKGMPLGNDEQIRAQWRFFRANLVEGTMPDSANHALISREMARLLALHVNDDVLCYFVGDRIRARRLHITGIYDTGFGDFDRLFILTDLPSVQQLNGWTSAQVSGIEILVDDLDHLERAAMHVFYHTGNRLDSEGNALYTQTLRSTNRAIFNWLDLLDTNVWIIIILMLCVSSFSMITGLIILILDSVQLIATLKALGATNRFVRRIFVTEAGMLVSRGLLRGNLIGLALCLLQYTLHIIPLDSATYYVSYVPVAFPWLYWLLLNIGTVLLALLVLLAPSAVASHVSPARVMRFD